MKITGNTSLFPPKTSNPSPHLDLAPKKSSPKRRLLSTRRRKAAAPSGKRSRPETPLLKWKTEVCVGDLVPDGGRKGAVSARKLAAGLWRLQLSAVDGGWQRTNERLGFQPASVSHVGLPFAYHRSGKEYGSEVKDHVMQASGTNNAFLPKHEPSFQNISCAMEGVTKWDPVSLKAPDEVDQIRSRVKLVDQHASAELEQARARIEELETERRSSKKKMEHFLKKVSEERAAWRSREHEKVRAFIEDMKAEVKRERKNRQRLEIANSRLVDELADAKLAAKRLMQDYEKERKARELIEEVCEELANEIGEEKAEVEALKRESMKNREEVEEERKMLQMAEVWREERVQMKLVDAKVAVEEKYSQMNKLVADLEAFLRSKNATSDVKEAEMLRQAAASTNIQEVQEFTYEPPNPDDIFSIFEDVNEREMEPYSHSPASRIRTVSPEVNKDSGWKGEIEDDESGWETVSHVEDEGSSYSPMSVDKGHQHSNVSGSGTDWDDNGTPITEISSKRQMKKVSSIAKLWRSVPNNDNGDSYKIVSVEGLKSRLSNASPGKGGLNSPDYMGQWSSPERGNPHINRGMKGCIEWPRGAQKNSLKAKLLEARMESQKVQLRHVLKHKY